jgi:hypothetical protein
MVTKKKNKFLIKAQKKGKAKMNPRTEHNTQRIFLCGVVLFAL